MPKSLLENANNFVRRQSRRTLGISAAAAITAVGVSAGVAAAVTGSPSHPLTADSKLSAPSISAPSHATTPAITTPSGPAPALHAATQPAPSHQAGQTASTQHATAASATTPGQHTTPAPAQSASAAPALTTPAAHAPAPALHAPAPAPAASAAPAAPAHTAPAAPAHTTAAHTTAAAPAPAHPAPVAPARPYEIYDSVTPSEIPPGPEVATYATGGFAVQPSQVAGRKVLWIDTQGTDPGAGALDVEPGDATPPVAASWTQQKLTADPGSLAVIYTMRSEWPAVQAAISTLPSGMQSHVRYWIADPTGVPHVVPGSSATQWYWGTNFDISTALPNF
jgi:hypothetical protein